MVFLSSLFIYYLLVHGAETDVVRIFDDKLDLTDTEMQRYLKQADLENNGFEKAVEFSTVTDEYGRKSTKKTIYYKVTDDCSQVGKWQRVLKERMPGALKMTDIFSKSVKEVEIRIAGRKTKRCAVMLEVHPGRCLKKSHEKSKRAAAKRCGWWIKCCGCGVCSRTNIIY
jgi:uncharacterized protein YxeA/NAD-dependent dihydropyrimidine dehydrogenase PreA subunit